MINWFQKKEKEPIYTQSEVDKLLVEYEKNIIKVMNIKINSLPKTMTPEEINDLVNKKVAIVDPAPFDSVFGKAADLIRTSVAETEYNFDRKFKSLVIPSVDDFYKLLNQYVNLRITSFEVDDKTIKAGSSASCKVIFNKPVPEYGCEVFINCDNPDVMFPNSVLVEKDKTEVEFEVKTFLGSEKYTAELSVLLHSQEKTIKITVSPPTK